MQLFRTHGLDGRVPMISLRVPLTPMDFFFWGYLKAKVYRTKPITIDALKLKDSVVIFLMILQLHLSSVFEAIPFHSMFINEGFLVIRSVSTIFLYTVFIL